MMKRARHHSTSFAQTQGTSDNEIQDGRTEVTQAEDATPVAKVRHTVRDEKSVRVHCYLPPHNPLPFSSYDDFETHYVKDHTNRCIECHKNLPSEHFLSLHIAENHDPITATRKDRDEKTYQCFVEGCEKICRTWQKRRMHLVDKHMFPRNYDFLVVNDGIDGRRSMLRPEKRNSRVRLVAGRTSLQHGKPSESEEIDDSPATSTTAESAVMTPTSSDELMDQLATDMSSLKFVPNSVRFGRKKGLSGFAKT